MPEQLVTPNLTVQEARRIMQLLASYENHFPKDRVIREAREKIDNSLLIVEEANV